ncbi:MAG: RNA ligase family protein [Planctomycetes bacterium]|nr:RNA ligase family protein [Planctomycetota bacterium]
MSDFVRFPRTPHLAWLGTVSPRDEKVLTSAEANTLLAGAVVVEEKIDGANLGISVDAGGFIQIQNRNQYIKAPHAGQFGRLASWLAPRHDVLRDSLRKNLVLFGEWCTARHSLHYSCLPDWFVTFDIYDRDNGRFWSTSRRDKLVREIGFYSVPTVFHGVTSLEKLKLMVVHERSRFGPESLEGFIIRSEGEEWLDSRAKLIHPEFAQSIADHWSRQPIQWNRLATCLASEDCGS